MKHYKCKTDAHKRSQVDSIYPENHMLSDNWTVKQDVEAMPTMWEEVDINSVEKALRFNSAKPKMSLLDLHSLVPAVQVLEFGMLKYSRNNWKKGLKRSEVIDSLMRHILAMQKGEEIDPESGLSHIGHIQCNAMFLGHPNTIKDEL